MRWRRRSRPATAAPGTDHPDDEAGDLAEECDAFLAGAYVDLLERRARPVPAWAWLNRLAHADEASLARLGDADLDAHRTGTGGWRTAQRWLAAVIVDLAGTYPGGVRQIQSEALVPLELALAGSDLDSDLDVRQVIALVLHTVSRRCRTGPARLGDLAAGAASPLPRRRPDRGGPPTRG